MTEAAEKQKLDNVLEKVKAASYSEKQNQQSEEQLIDAFLDAINTVKKDLVKRTGVLNEIAEAMEELTWMKNLDQPTLQKLNELIVLARDVHHTLIKNYVGLNIFRQKGIAKNEISDFKEAIDLLKECTFDLESVFFNFPKNTDFVQTTNALESLA
jgi:hypothetical protein